MKKYNILRYGKEFGVKSLIISSKRNLNRYFPGLDITHATVVIKRFYEYPDMKVEVSVYRTIDGSMHFAALSYHVKWEEINSFTLDFILFAIGKEFKNGTFFDEN